MVTRPAVSRPIVTRPAISRAEHLVVFLARPRFDRLRSFRRLVATRSAGPKMLFKPGLTGLEVVVRPV
jgi:hypothetical protein